MIGVTLALAVPQSAAAMLLSTAIPGRGIDAPELLTWTLGERSEFVPQLRAAGVQEETIRGILVDNPRRFLAFVPKKPRRS